MFQVQEVESLAYMLENVVFFCIGQAPKEIEQRQKDHGNIEILKLTLFKGTLQNQRDVDTFRDANSLSCLEGQAVSEKKVYVLVAPTFLTLKIAYASMRGWCTSGIREFHLNYQFDEYGLLPLIPQPKRPRR